MDKAEFALKGTKKRVFFVFSTVAVLFTLVFKIQALRLQVGFRT